MARQYRRHAPDREETLHRLTPMCPVCGAFAPLDYHNSRSVVGMQEQVKYTLKIRRCRNEACDWFRRPLRPEAEGRLALPYSEYGFDVLAFIGRERFAFHRTVPEIHTLLSQQQVEISQRQVTHLIARYEELLASKLMHPDHWQAKLQQQGRVILSLDGLQPDVGHDVLWLIREVLSGEILLARPLVTSSEDDLASLLREVKEALTERLPVVGVISDGQRAIRLAIQQVFPGIPHQLCQFHSLREAARPLLDVDRHAKVQLKKRLRGVKKIESALEARQDPQARVLLDYALTVRSALTDDGRPPLVASGLRLQERIQHIHDSLERLEETPQKKGGVKPIKT
ncbi:hypothetical protein [Deinococcus sp. QL22]|uniref:hypothetical protein n=1 Tax=Deinococcus sp. QL22 TaxID=2939437 RepID=UPI0020175876|nr:hypothetical protein [Deinococcus sp. QL22]UQN09166.1 hypothetical protein M1R55_24305 [Deinococcus sp. QL22]